MKRNLPRNRAIIIMLMIVLAALTLAGCGTEQQNASAQRQAAASGGEEISSEEAQAIVAKALAQDFTSVRFKMETRTTATAASEGQSVTQTVKTNTTGELNRAENDKWLHMDYEVKSSDQPGKVAYEMYLADENMTIVQGEEMYNNPLTSEEVETYVNSIVQVTNEEELAKLLSVARSCKLRTGEDGTKTIVITVDVDRIEETDIVDTSSLPEGCSITTMVVSYSFDDSDRFKSVRLSSNTVGTPTYRVNQSYEFYDYDQVNKPEWPDFESYMLEKSGLQKDESGRFYFVDDNGTVYYVDSIDEDGMIHFVSPGTNASSNDAADQAGYNYYYEGADAADDASSDAQSSAQQQGNNQDTSGNKDNDTASNGATNTDSSTSSGGTGSTGTSSEQGRAYIPLGDGTVIYLDEPGNEIVDLGSGVTALRTPDGGFYILSYGDD